MTSKDHLNFMAYSLNEQIRVRVVGNNVSWNALKWLKLTIDVISMPLKNMGLKDNPFKPILNLNFIAWMNIWCQWRFVFIVIQIQNHLRFQIWAYKPLGRMKMLPIFGMQHLTSIKTQFFFPQNIHGLIQFGFGSHNYVPNLGGITF